MNYENDVEKAFQVENTGNFAEGGIEVLYVDSKWIDLASKTQMQSVKNLGSLLERIIALPFDPDLGLSSTFSEQVMNKFLLTDWFYLAPV